MSNITMTTDQLEALLREANSAGWYLGALSDNCDPEAYAAEQADLSRQNSEA